MKSLGLKMENKNLNSCISEEMKILKVFHDYQNDKETFKVSLSKLIDLGIKKETAIKCLFEPVSKNPLDIVFQKKLMDLFFDG